MSPLVSSPLSVEILLPNLLNLPSALHRPNNPPPFSTFNLQMVMSEEGVRVGLEAKEKLSFSQLVFVIVRIC